MTRRLTLYIFGTAVLGVASLAPVAFAAGAPPQVQTQSPGYYRIMVGSDEVTALSDGVAPRDPAKIMSKPDEIRQALANDHEAAPVDLSINAFLINTGQRLILVDTGAGELFGPTSGHVVDNIRAAGYKPEQIDAILLTHIHADHSGGLTVGGRRVFPNAVVYVDKRDPDFWLNADTEKANPARATTFKQSQQTVNPYVAAGKLKKFDGATTLFPGIRSVPAYGHTPGHSGYMIESGGQKLLLWGDTVHLAEVQFADPDVTIDYDVDADKAIASRKQFFADAAKQGYLVGGAHISFPGLGHVSVDANGYHWHALPYSDVVKPVKSAP
jgi:glyoxylase-like metal-dependent hydrolase (beta-lactamase superfamily II)